MTQTCQNCKNQFFIDPSDHAFYEKMRVPEPSWCAECRLIRRMLWRNERGLYRRPCSKCGAEKITMYPATSSYTVYCLDCWWADAWDGMDYAREYDFSRNFFSQFRELFKAVPRPAVIQQQNVRCEYANRVSNSKDCYLIFGSNNNESCFYGTQVNDSKDSMDCMNLQQSELCYECIDCFGSYRLRYSKDCLSCTDSYFLTDCRNCSDCFGCVNLRNKRYCFFNQELTKEAYSEALAGLHLHTRHGSEAARKQTERVLFHGIFPNIISRQCEDVSGNWLDAVKGGHNCFACRDIENGKNLFAVIGAKDVQDYTCWGRGSELIYDTISVGLQCSNIRFCNELWNSVMDAQYSMNCPGSRHIFGCVGLKKKEYCIFNQQYSASEFEEMVPRIMQHMSQMPYVDALGRRYGYGEFFPPELSPFGYNETMAQEYFPKTETEIRALGFNYAAGEKKGHGVTIDVGAVPDDIETAGDEILSAVIRCAHAPHGVVGRSGSEEPSGSMSCTHQCASAFKVTPKELEFYRREHVPLPTECHNCRHFLRLAKRNPIHLWGRGCMCGGATNDLRLMTNDGYKNTVAHAHSEAECPNEFDTSYSPERPEVIYCERCYQAEIV